MNTITTHVLLDEYEALFSPLGRWRRRLDLQWKQMFWRWLVSGADAGKRMCDVLLSTLALMMLSPALGLIAALIKIEDKGPVYFSQERVGRFGRRFRMYKFRSMCPGAEERLRDLLKRNQHREGVTFKIKDDPRVTKIGKVLRKYSLDELPQFFNVWRGDMTLVGPRPPVPREVARYSLSDRRRLEAKPGITCFWQIGGRSEIDFSRQVELDVRYIETQNFWLDMSILVKTIPAVINGKGAC
jgi:lipopolysaccharide/colanic/teichoic acid biosynthesis glycosyltransferase